VRHADDGVYVVVVILVLVFVVTRMHFQILIKSLKLNVLSLLFMGQEILLYPFGMDNIYRKNLKEV